MRPGAGGCQPEAMNIASGVRIGWLDLPDDVRQAVEAIIGGRVVEAASQAGGFSPGTADRVRTADGRRAFVKAVSPDLNDHSVVMHRREAEIAAAMPASVPAPRLLGSHDDGHWIVLVFEDVAGRQPTVPWQPDELQRVLLALENLSAIQIPPALAELPPAAERAEEFGGWHNLRADPPADLDPWIARRLDQLCALAERGRRRWSATPWCTAICGPTTCC
jgi:hypothetical protein